MKNPVNTRLLAVHKILNLGQNEFCFKAGVSNQTYQKLKNAEEIRKSVVLRICDAFNVNPEYIFDGKGEMFLPAQGEAKVTSIEIERLREENSRLQREIDRLWQLIGHDRKVNFLRVA